MAVERKLKICFVTEDFYPEFIGGQGVYGYHLVAGLNKLGCEVTVLAEDKVGRREFWKNTGIKALLVPFCFGNQLILAFWEYLIFRFRCSNLYFDIVHANQLSGLFFALLRPSNVGKIIVSAYNTNYDMAQITTSPIKRLLYQPLIYLERIIYQRADGILFNSPDEERALVKYYQIKVKTKSIFPGVDMMEKLGQERKTNRQKTVLYVGRLVKRKKVDTLIKAINLIKSVKLLIVGQGIERENLEKIAGPNVKFLGFIDDTRPYFLRADLFVTVSLAEGGFLLSALEAASFGLPLILSPEAAGFPIIKEGVNGFIADPNDYKSLSKKIIQVLKNSKQMGLESRKLASNFSWDSSVKRTVKFYEEIRLNV